MTEEAPERAEQERRAAQFEELAGIPMGYPLLTPEQQREQDRILAEREAASLGVNLGERF